MRAVRNREYGPGGIGRRKSSIWICLGMVFRRVREGGQKQGISAGSIGRRKSSIWIRLNMVFLMVRESGQKQGIWTGKRQEAKIIDLESADNRRARTESLPRLGG